MLLENFETEVWDMGSYLSGLFFSLAKKSEQEPEDKDNNEN